MEQSRPATIAEAAQRLKLSTVTVSRVINGSYKVSPHTRERVVAALRAWGFQPNEAARTLVRRRSDVIGLMLSGQGSLPLASWYQAEYLRGIAQEAAHHDFNLLIYARRDRPERPADPVAAVRARQVDGFLLLGTARESACVPRLLQERIPFLVLGLPVAGQTGNYFYYDNEGGMYEATRHLIELGHRRVAFVQCPSLPNHNFRLQGFRKAVLEAGLMPIEWEYPRERTEVAQAVVSGMRRPDRPTALVVPHDSLASDLTRGLAEAGFHVPAEVSVVTFDDTPAATLSQPPLTTVRQPLMDIGALAMKRLVQMIESGTWYSERQILPATLIVRGSTGKPPGAL